jgi:hypothetical protein
MKAPLAAKNLISSHLQRTERERWNDLDDLSELALLQPPGRGIFGVRDSLEEARQNHVLG